MASHTGSSFLIRVMILLNTLAIALSFRANQSGFGSGACVNSNQLLRICCFEVCILPYTLVQPRSASNFCLSLSINSSSCHCVPTALAALMGQAFLEKCSDLKRQQLEKYPDKTFIGKIEKGFDFLGYHFCRAGLRVADVTWNRFIEKATRLYEQEQAAPEGAALLGLYVRRWVRWAGAGMA